MSIAYDTHPRFDGGRSIAALRRRWEDRTTTPETWSSALVLTIGLLVILTFLVGMASAPPTALTPDGVDATVRTFDRSSALMSWLVHVGALAAVGAAWFRSFVVEGARVAEEDRAVDLRGPVEQLVAAGCALGAVASVVTLPLRAVVVSGRIAAAFELDALWFTATSPFGAAALVRATGLVLLAVLIRQPPRRFHRPITFVRGEVNVIAGISAGPVAVTRVKTVACIALVLGAYTLTGHPQASSPRWLLTGAQLVHLAAAAVWFGGVVALIAVTARVRAEGHAVEAAAVLERFSLSAALAVAAVSLSGTALAISQLGSVGALWGTAYGRTILLKLCLVGIIMAIGGYNHRFLVPRVVAGDDDGAWSRLWRTVIAEAGVLAGGVLLVTAALLAGGVEGMVGR